MKKVLSLLMVFAMLISSFTVFAAEEKTYSTVAFIGGSITEQNTWIGSGTDPVLGGEYTGLAQYFNAKYGSQYVINAGISGTGSDLGAYRINDEVLKYDPDLVFIEFAVNDSGRTDSEKLRQIEGLIRLIKKHNASTEIVLLYTASRNMGTDHEMQDKLAEYYGLKTVDLYNALIGEFSYGGLTHQTLDINGDGVLSEDEVVNYYTTGPHVNDAGGHRYADYIKLQIEAENSILGNTPLDKPSLSGYDMSNPQFTLAADLDSSSFEGSWTEKNISTWSFYPVGNTPEKSALTSAADGAACLAQQIDIRSKSSQTIGDKLIFNFSGSSIGMLYQCHSNGALVSYNVDNGLRTGLIDTYGEGTYSRNADFYISDLGGGEHTITFKIENRADFPAMNYVNNENEFAVSYLTSDSGSTYNGETAQTDGLVFELGKDANGNFINTLDNSAVEMTGNVKESAFITLGGMKTAYSFDNESYLSADVSAIKNEPEQTFMVWAKPKEFEGASQHYDSFLSYSDSTGSVNPSTDMLFEIGSTWYGLGTQMGYSDSSYSQYIGNNNGLKYIWQNSVPDWRCYIVTKKWNGDNSTWIYKTYVMNLRTKTLQPEYNVSLAEETAGFRGDESNMKLYIGTSVYGDTFKNFEGQIGSVKVYNRALSEKEVNTLARGERQDYIEVLDNSASLKVESVFPSNTYSVAAGETTFKVNFNNSVNPSTISGIKLLKKNSDGTTTDVNASVVSVNTEYKTFSVTATVEEGSEYILSVDSTVTSIGGVSAEPFAAVYTVRSQGIVFSLGINDDGTVYNKENPNTVINKAGDYSLSSHYLSNFEKVNSISFDGNSYIEAEVQEARNLEEATYIVWFKPDADDGNTSENNPWGVWSLSDNNAQDSSPVMGLNWFFLKENNYYHAQFLQGATKYYTNRFDWHSPKNQILDQNNSEWRNIVITRKVTKTGTTTDTDTKAEMDLCTVSSQGHINGAPSASYPDFTATNDNNVRIDESSFNLDIGASASQGNKYYFKGKIADMKIYNRVLSDEEIAEYYNDTKANYEEFELADTLELTSTSPANITDNSGAVLSISSKAIKLNFNNYIDKNTLNAITFAKADGTAVSGYTVSLDDESASTSKTVKINLSDLLEPHTNYILSITSDLKSVNGKSITAVSKTFKTGNEGIVFDMKIKSDGNVVNGENSSTVITKQGTPGVATSMSESGKLITALNFGGNSYVEAEVQEARNLEEATYVLWMKPSENDGTAINEKTPWGVFSFNNKHEGASPAIGLSWFYGENTGNNAYYFMQERQGASNAGSEYFNWHHLKNNCINTGAPKWTNVIITRKVEKKDDANSIVSYETYTDGGIYSKLTNSYETNTVNEKDFVLTVGAMFDYCTGLNPAYFKGEIADMKVYNRVLSVKEIEKYYADTAADYRNLTELPNSLELVSTTPADLNADPSNEMAYNIGKIKLNFNNFVDSATLGAISFAKEDGSPVPGGYKVSLDSDSGKTVNVEFGVLTPGGTYIVNISNKLKSVNGYAITDKECWFAVSSNASALNAVFLDRSGEPITEVGKADTIIAQLDIPLYNDLVAGYTPYLAVYSKNKLVKIVSGTVREKPDGTAALTASLTGITAADNIDSVKLFVWDKNLMPVTEVQHRGNTYD